MANELEVCMAPSPELTTRIDAFGRGPAGCGAQEHFAELQSVGSSWNGKRSWVTALYGVNTVTRLQSVSASAEHQQVKLLGIEVRNAWCAKCKAEYRHKSDSAQVK